MRLALVGLAVAVLCGCKDYASINACHNEVGKPHWDFSALGPMPAMTLDATAVLDGVEVPASLERKLAALCTMAPAETLQAEFTAPRAGKLTELRLRMTIAGFVPQAWWSQGFQSWSQSGILAVADLPADPSAVAAALALRGDAETQRDGRALSWWGTVVGAADGKGYYALAKTAATWKSWARVGSAAGQPLVLELVCGAGESVAVEKGQTILGEAFEFGPAGPGGGGLATFGARMADRRPIKPEIGWNSWYELWDGVDEAAFAANVTEAKALLQPAAQATKAPLRVVIDDGWQIAWGDWRPNGKFPSGLGKIVAANQAQGLQTGVWLAPLLVDAKLPLAKDHPDWFVGGAVYPHLAHGDMRVIDVTHPDAAAYLASEIKALKDAGLTLLKIDFLFAGTWEGARKADVTGMQAYAQALALIRKAAGDGVQLLAVGSPPLGTIGKADGWRFGPDIALQLFGAQWPFLPSELRTLAVRWPYCSAILCDADPALLRDLPANEVAFGAATVMLAGGGWWLSDDLTKLAADAKARGATADWIAAAVSGKRAVPQGIFVDNPPQKLVSALQDFAEGQSRHAVPNVWKLADGRKVLVNAGDAAVSVEGKTVAGRGVVVQ